MFILQGFQKILRTRLQAGGKSPKWSCGLHDCSSKSPILTAFYKPQKTQVSKFSTYIALKALPQRTWRECPNLDSYCYKFTKNNVEILDMLAPEPWSHQTTRVLFPEGVELIP